MSVLRERLTIRDLEQFSGIKAHTIRIWERRYGLLKPQRTTTNLRRYGLDELKAVLNVAFLSKHGMRISRIAAATPAQRDNWVQEWSVRSDTDTVAMDELKLATLAYDTIAFRKVGERFEERFGFEALFERLYLPYLEQLGLLWQTSAVCPAQEHFASLLVRQSLISRINADTPVRNPKNELFVLFLPENELHELGLLYTQFLLQRAGRTVIYLGQSVPLADLARMARHFQRPMTFIGMGTCMPPEKEVGSYVERMVASFDPEQVKVLLGGRLFGSWENDGDGPVKVFRSLAELRERLSLV
ncbi:MAG TPA: MerR family transcriptional regulator [Flavobacteriales bacterium]